MNKDVIIIGGGVIGTSIAYHLGKKGISSTIVERESIGARASGKSWAIMAYPPIHLIEEKFEGGLFEMPEGVSHRSWIDLYWSGWYRNSDICDEIKDIGGIDPEFSAMDGALLAFSQEEVEALKAEVEYLHDLGFYEASWIEGKSVKDVYPNVNQGVLGGIHTPLLQWEPYKYTLGLAQAAEKMGAEVKLGEVTGFGTEGNSINSVKLSSGKELYADKVIMAMGPWSGQGTSWLGKEVPQVITPESCLRFEVDKKLPLFLLLKGDACIIPKLNGEVICGFVAKKHFQEGLDFRLSEDEKMNILEEAVDLLPELENAKIVEFRGDIEAWSPGPVYNKPVLGQMPEYENGYIATNFGTLGQTQAAGVGVVMSEWIADGKPSLRFSKMMDYLKPGY